VLSLPVSTQPISPESAQKSKRIKQRWHCLAVSGLLAVLLPLLGCASQSQSGSNSATKSTGSPAADAATGGEPVQIVAAENFWGSIAAQVGGDRVKVTSIINNPDTDPHDYEPKPADARLLARAQYVIVNGVGYDPWANKLVEANPNPGRKVLDIGTLVGKQAGDNPHLWYNPNYVLKVVDRVTADLKAIDPEDAAYYDQERAEFLTTGLKDYKATIAAIRKRYAGTPVGSTESIFAYLAEPLGLKLITPSQFMNAIAEGEEPSVADKAVVDQQLTGQQIKLLVFNSQNATPDTDALKRKAEQNKIPIVPITETPPPKATFQEWQTVQLKALQQALAKATGR
jgi:zinc/manganese transport system substrate-binding protein